MTLIIMESCNDHFPGRQSVGSNIIIEFICILDKGHDGHHRSKDGVVWVNQFWQDRQYLQPKK